MKNSGIKIGNPKTDYRAGRIRGVLPYEVRNPDGNWKPWLPKGELQFNDDGDSMACTNFAVTNAVEMQVKFLTNKEINYSDRELAIRSGNTPEGNYLYKPADAIRNGGLCFEDTYPAPKEPWTWESYHAPIPEDKKPQIEKECEAWLLDWDLKREQIDLNRASILKHLKQAPLAVIIPGHAVAQWLLDENDVHHYFDSYEPFLKKTTNIQYAMKLVLTKRKEALDPDMLLVDIELGDQGSSVLKLKRAIRRTGREVPEGDLYDDELKQIVWETQQGILEHISWTYLRAKFWYHGELVDRGTRKAINKILTYR